MQVSAGRRYLLCAGADSPYGSLHGSSPFPAVTFCSAPDCSLARCGDTNTRIQWTDTHTSAADTCHLLDKVLIAVSLTCFLVATQLMSTSQMI